MPCWWCSRSGISLVQKLNCLLKLNHKQDVQHHRVLLWCRLVQVCDLEAPVWWQHYITSDPCTIHHLNSQASIKSLHYTDHTAACQSTEALEPTAEPKWLSSARWSRCASTSCCALMVFGRSAASCLRQAESWTKRKRHQQTSKPDPKHVQQPGCWSQTHEFMTFRVKLATQSGVQWSVCY